jgi:hypothetical protein
MATRTVFVPLCTFPWFKEYYIDFDWVPGLEKTQIQKSIRNLHKEAKHVLGIEKILEVSTRSEDVLGLKLSAFNLKVRSTDCLSSIESTYQSSKVFENSVQYIDIIQKDALAAKTDARLKNSGKLTGYRFQSLEFRLLPSPNFYDYLYIRGLIESGEAERVLDFEAFTDHAFSGHGKVIEGKSVNCQARSLAIFVGLSLSNQQDSAIDVLLKEASRVISPIQAELFEY